jgi:hypothetical protein
MEYTFRNSSGEPPTTVLLADQCITIKQGQDEYSVPYIGVIQVNLDKVGPKIFRAVLHLEGHRPVVITNRYHAGQSSVEDRSRAYSTFVRVLHYHLKDKSRASYASGSDASRLWTQVIAAAAISFVLSFTGELLGIRFLNPVVQGVILSAAMGLLILAWRAGHWPKTYKPTEIPMRFLP